MRGINGIMIDVGRTAGCTALPAGALTPAQIAATFAFQESTTRTLAGGFAGNVRVPTSVSIAPHPTLPLTDRITIIFPDKQITSNQNVSPEPVANASTNSRWLRTRIVSGGVIDNVTPIAGGDLDRFYFGLAVAEGMSISTTNAVTASQDQNDCKAPNTHTTVTRAQINDPYDYNRDSLVSSIDQNAPKVPNTTTTVTALSLAGSAP
jgi:hypothetical protein